MLIGIAVYNKLGTVHHPKQLKRPYRNYLVITLGTVRAWIESKVSKPASKGAFGLQVGPVSDSCASMGLLGAGAEWRTVSFLTGQCTKGFER